MYVVRAPLKIKKTVFYLIKKKKSVQSGEGDIKASSELLMVQRNKRLQSGTAGFWLLETWIDYKKTENLLKDHWLGGVNFIRKE